MQSPLRVFAYWELRDATIEAALRSIPIRDHQNFQLLLKWNEIDATRELHSTRELPTTGGSIRCLSIVISWS